MTDLRLDRAQRAPLLVRPACGTENLAQRRELGRVAGACACAVRLDELDCLRSVAGRLIRAPQRAHLTGRQRRIDGRAPAIGGGAYTADDGIHAVTVALGVGEGPAGASR